MLTSVFLLCDLPREEVAPGSLSWPCRSLVSVLLAMLFQLRDWFTPAAPLWNNRTTAFSVGRDTLCLERMTSGDDYEKKKAAVSRDKQADTNSTEHFKELKNYRKGLKGKIMTLFRITCNGKSRLLLKPRVSWGLWNHHVIPLAITNGHSDTNRTTDHKHKTSLSWGTKRHFCLLLWTLATGWLCREFAWGFFETALKVPHGKLPRQWSSVSVWPVWSSLCQHAAHSV